MTAALDCELGTPSPVCSTDQSWPRSPHGATAAADGHFPPPRATCPRCPGRRSDLRRGGRDVRHGGVAQRADRRARRDRVVGDGSATASAYRAAHLRLTQSDPILHALLILRRARLNGSHDHRTHPCSEPAPPPASARGRRGPHGALGAALGAGTAHRGARRSGGGPRPHPRGDLVLDHRGRRPASRLVRLVHDGRLDRLPGWSPRHDLGSHRRHRSRRRPVDARRGPGLPDRCRHPRRHPPGGTVARGCRQADAFHPAVGHGRLRQRPRDLDLHRPGAVHDRRAVAGLSDDRLRPLRDGHAPQDPRRRPGTPRCHCGPHTFHRRGEHCRAQRG